MTAIRRDKLNIAKRKKSTSKKKSKNVQYLSVGTKSVPASVTTSSADSSDKKILSYVKADNSIMKPLKSRHVVSKKTAIPVPAGYKPATLVCLECGRRHKRTFAPIKRMQAKIEKMFPKKKVVAIYMEYCDKCMAITLHQIPELSPETAR